MQHTNRSPFVCQGLHVVTWMAAWGGLLAGGFPHAARGQDHGQDIVPLARAHAHNDYYHARPLLDAVEHGFCSVEADIFLKDGQLLVGHSRAELKPERTLEALYLVPLAKRIELQDGRVFKNGPPFTLLVDIKSDGLATYRALHKTLQNYAPLLTRVEQGQPIAGAITIVVSGERPIAAIQADDPRYVGIDGRLSDLESSAASHLFPLISDNWRNHFQWRGTGPMPEPERARLRQIVEQAHASGRRVRFWATPESSDVWRELQAADVDLINTDQLAQLRDVLLDSGKDRP